MNSINFLKNGQNYDLEYGKTIVIIGANGSGKSRLGAWIEQQNPKNVHRISAQRNLSFNPEVPLRSYEKSKKFFYFGNDFIGHQANYLKQYTLQAKESQRWEQGKYTTGLLNDYDHLLSILFSEQNLRNEEVVKKIDNHIGGIIDEQFKPSSNIEKLIDIWNKLLPHRELKFTDQKIVVKKDDEEYIGTELSDGERVIMYLIGEVLSIDPGFILIIDEPEIHIHKSIVNILWDELERLRDDIGIVYITHDLDFTRERFGSKKIWVKSFDGKQNWDFEEIDFDDEEKYHQVYFEIMGSRKPVLFVEGEKGSLDYKFYSLVYDKYTVIPVQSCNTVIEMVSSYKKEWTLHNIMPVGIVDKDFREENEIETLQVKGIYTLNVLEIENLFCLPDIIGYIYDSISSTIYIDKQKEEVLNETKNIIQETFASERNKFILNATHKRLSSQLCKFKKPKHTENIETKYTEHLSNINLTEIQTEITTFYANIFADNDVNKMLCFIDNKGLSAKFSVLFSMSKDQYIGTILKHLDDQELKKIFLEYIPKLGEMNDN